MSAVSSGVLLDGRLVIDYRMFRTSGSLNTDSRKFSIKTKDISTGNETMLL